ncbi:MAG: polyprenyl synthetase family protein [Planctomycetia bacterium]|nr:polyprenyl synthetase family protein [Planctomycetia bacterium]
MHHNVSCSSSKESYHMFYAPVQDEMEQVENLLQSIICSNDMFTDRVTRYGFQLSGKRMRPALLLLFGRTLGNILPIQIQLAAAAELFHSASLAHDDVLDESEQRRHLPTVNQLWNNETSVLLGDFLVARAIRQVTSLGNPDISHSFAKMSCRLCEGEMRQVGSRGNYHLTEEEYRKIISDKTASLFECVCYLGVYTALSQEMSDEEKQKNELVRAASTFGHHLGMAFQIVDDLLDISGDENSMGKSLGTDLEKQKMTLPMIYFLKRLSVKEKEDFIFQLQHSFSPELRLKIRDQFMENGILEEVRLAAEAHLAQAESELQKFPVSAARDALCAINRFVLQRNK